MRRALLVSPYFVPCNLAGIHRVRLLANGLPEFGWLPTVLAVHPRYYGSMCEPDLSQLLPEGLRIEYVDAIPPALASLMGVSDLSLLGFWHLRERIRSLLSSGEIDLVFVTVLPGYAGLLGGWAKRRFGVSFVLDYQDPWVSDWGASQAPFSKAGIVHRLAEALEPKFASLADAVTAVSNATLDGLRRRGTLRRDIPTAEVPIGSDSGDHIWAERVGVSHLRRLGNCFNLAYIGTVSENQFPVLRAVFNSLRRLADQPREEVTILHLVGTSARAEGGDSIRIERMAEECGVAALVRIEPKRVPYLDALRTMQEADALLILGTTERHYTASKVFPYWLTGKMIFGIVHEESTLWDIAKQIGGVHLCSYMNEGELEKAADNMVRAIHDVQGGRLDVVQPRNLLAYESYSARGVSRAFASVFDNVLERSESSSKLLEASEFRGLC